MSPLPSFLAGAPPSVGVEIAADRVTSVSLSRQGGAYTIAGHGTVTLPKGAVTPALNGVNIHDRATVAAAIRAAFDRLGSRPRRVGLVIPDTAAKVSLLRFEKVPAEKDLDQLIRWQVRKGAPFKPEDAQISWAAAAVLPDGSREFLVTLARRDIIESYEAVCADAGASAGVVDLASLNLINAAMASRREAAAGDWLIVHVASDYATLAIVRGNDLIFFRTRQLEAAGDLADTVHQTAMYHEDRLGGGQFGRVLLSGASLQAADAGEEARRGLEERLGVRVDAVDFRDAAALRDRINPSPDVMDALAPALGILLRERVA